MVTIFFLRFDDTNIQYWFESCCFDVQYLFTSHDIDQVRSIIAFVLAHKKFRYYIQACIYYLIRSISLDAWLNDPTIMNHIASLSEDYVEMDPIFSSKIDILILLFSICNVALTFHT
jgi:hypothetical protein